MKRIFILSSFVFLVQLLSGRAVAQDEFDKIRKNIIAGLAGQAKDVSGFKDRQLADGSWNDINYKDEAITAWKPIAHLQRIKTYCVAINRTKSTDLNNHIIAGLRYWLSVSPKSKNWWHNEIAAPQEMGEILLLVDEAGMIFPRSLKDSLVGIMKKGDPYKQAGANKLDIAIHYLYRACATKDGGLMKAAVEQAFQPISIGEKEGIQYDYSFLQHGRQLQLSSYGLVFLMGEYRVAAWVMGSRFALSSEKLNILQTYLTQTYLRTIRGEYSDFSVEGRGISRPGVLHKKSSVPDGYTDNTNTWLAYAKKLSPANTAITNAMARIQGAQAPGFGVNPCHQYFYKGDYTLHLREAYSFNVRTVSSRTIRTEAGNGENLFGKFLPDGATDIQRTGSEYYNIMPVWEWDKIPGITCRDFATDQPTTAQWGEPGSTAFVGGVSDGKYGCTVYDMNYNDVTAKKAWFFFDKEVVCLGAGINCTAGEHVTTTLNQCWLQGKAVVDDNPVHGISRLTNPFCIWHDSIGYYLLQKNNVVLSVGEQNGSWKKINQTYSPEEVLGNVFKLFIDHGSKPNDAGYAYCVVPSISLQEAHSYPVNDIEVVANNSSVQAVANSALQMVQVCFYTRGSFSYHQLKITVDKPCLLLIKKINGQQPELWVADPLQLETVVAITLQAGAKRMVKTVQLPGDKYKGRSVRAQ
ncbi:MAG: hypothetical protein J7539_12675 [Niabella sp.]|nr:hypothetical protein [Niabella sp.]